MMRVAAFSQAEIERLIRAAKKTGFRAVRILRTADGATAYEISEEPVIGGKPDRPRPERDIRL